jgi:hypothetical protein
MNFNDLTVFHLKVGGHYTPDEGLCFMEAAAWLAGETHSDRPDCVCPVIGAYTRVINDNLDDVARQKLVAYLPRVIGTRSPEHEQERAEYLAWQAIRVFAPIALDIAGLPKDAANLRGFQGSLKAAADAIYAAAAANAAAAAANAAADAIYAADAVNAADAVHAADAAANAADAAADVDLTIGALDGVLAIGPSGAPVPGWSARVSEYRALVDA